MTDYPTAGPDLSVHHAIDYSGLRVDGLDDGGSGLNEPMELTPQVSEDDMPSDPRVAAAAAAAPGSPARQVDPEEALGVNGAEDAPVGSPAEALAAELSATFSTVTVPQVTVPVPGRRGWFLRFRLDWTERQARERRAGAADPSSPDGFSAERIFVSTIAEQCVAILKRDPDTGLDQPLLGAGTRRPLTFRDPALWPLLVHPVTKVRPTSAKAAVRCLLPFFTQVSQVGLDVSRAAGQEGLADPLDLD